MWSLLADLAMVLVGLVDMGLESHGVVLEHEQEDAGLLELVVLDGDAGLFLELTKCALVDCLAWLDLATKSEEREEGKDRGQGDRTVVSSR